jgi:hypothetical protein
VLYVTNQDGSYTQTNSDGWEVENVVLEQAWEEIDQQLEEARQQVMKGVSSPIAYYMIKSRMDIGILAAYVNKWQWQVRRHLKPDIFKGLSSSLLEKYAKVLNITVDELKKLS